MTDYIRNPRRFPRIPVRCEMRVALGSGGFVAAQTAVVGPGGCGGETARGLPLDARVFVELRSDRIQGARLLTGRVVWAARAAPWRWGIAYDRECLGVAAALFEELAAAHPELAVRPPLDGIGADAVLVPVVPPEGVDAFEPPEAEVLRALGEGKPAGALRDELGARWPSRLNPLFALLERHAVEVAWPSGGGPR